MKRVEHAPGLVVEWTNREAAKIDEIKARRHAGRIHRRYPGRLTPHDKWVLDLWRYYEYFFTPELRLSRDMKWEARNDNS